jgi:Amidases related to nicotinamidase
MKLRLTPFDALIVVDVQRDFMPGGALPVPEGDKVVAPLNEYIERFSKANLPVFFTRDWHPKDHISFKGHGGIWPPHCVQDTEGAQFHPDLKSPQTTSSSSQRAPAGTLTPTRAFREQF